MHEFTSVVIRLVLNLRKPLFSVLLNDTLKKQLGGGIVDAKIGECVRIEYCCT